MFVSLWISVLASSNLPKNRQKTINRNFFHEFKLAHTNQFTRTGANLNVIQVIGADIPRAYQLCLPAFLTEDLFPLIEQKSSHNLKNASIIITDKFMNRFIHAGMIFAKSYNLFLP